MIEQGTIQGLAAGMVVVTAPLFADLAFAVVGNLFTPHRQRGSCGHPIRLAVVVPAHNEEPLVARTVSSIRAAEASVPVFVIAHNCSDRTAEMAASAGAKVVELNDSRQRGKAAALRCGFQTVLQNGANAVLVIDADTAVSKNLLKATSRALAAGAPATQCRYEMLAENGAGSGPLVRLRALAVRGMNVLRARGRTGLGLSTGLFGNGFALTAETLKQVPFSVDSIVEDLEYHARLVASGIRVEWIGDAFAHAQLSPAGSAQARQEARWEGGRLRVAGRSTCGLLTAFLRGEWRALETLADIWSLPLSRGILILLMAAAVPSHWLHLYALACAAITLAYVLAAALLGANPVRDLAALVAAPAYLVWKAATTPLALMQSRSRAEWARTTREAPQQ